MLDASAFGTNLLQWGLTLSSEETIMTENRSSLLELLQWGLTLSSEETGSRTGRGHGHLAASMGPHSFERGNLASMWTAGYVRLASMGPHSFERGNAQVDDDKKPKTGASMGPHSFERGNLHPRMISGCCRTASMGPHSFERGNPTPAPSIR